MWLRNYYNLLTAALLGDKNEASGVAPADYTPPIRVRLADGSYKQAVHEPGGSDGLYGSRDLTPLLEIGKRSFAGLLTSEPTSYNSPGAYLALGTGSTAVTYDDYKLASMANLGSLVAQGGALKTPSTYDSDTHKYKSERSFTITNSSSDPKTVREIGIYVGGGYANTSYINLCLVYREVLEEAITLEQGESIVITFTRDGEVYNYTPY